MAVIEKYFFFILVDVKNKIQTYLKGNSDVGLFNISMPIPYYEQNLKINMFFSTDISKG
jgi:hypothetical protein